MKVIAENENGMLLKNKIDRKVMSVTTNFLI